MNIALSRRSTLEATRSELAAAKAQLQATEHALVKARETAENEQKSFDPALLEPSIAPLRAGLNDLRSELLRHQIANRWSLVDAVERARGAASEFRTCSLCGVANPTAAFKVYTSNCIFGGGILTRHQCPACDVIFGADKMFALSPGELALDYEWHYKVYQEGDSTEAELRAFHSLHPRRNGIYVNYGAGSWSRTVPLLREQGWNVFAYEPHGSAAAGGDWVISSEAQMHGRQFDGLFSNNVLEHLRQPADDLRRMTGWLKPGATMAHATPCFEYLYEFTRFHLFFFPGRSREQLADRAGLRIESFEADGEFMNCVFSPLR